MKIIMIGTGYVGLTSGVCFAHIGHEVVCIDIDKEKVKKLRNSSVPIYEPGLEKIMRTAIKKGKLQFDTVLKPYIANTDAIFIAVQTPQDKDGKADLQFVKTAAKHIGIALHAKKAKQYPVIVDKSTVPVGTAQLVKKIIKKEFDGEFDVASNPEFLREGDAIQDFLKGDRVIIGTDTEHAKKVLTDIYKGIESELFFTSIESSEMIKYASNAFLATKISFINEIANVCEDSGADVLDVAKGMGMDKRIGNKFLKAGIGYGGSCFPKDVRALHSIALNNGYTFHLLKAVIEVNNKQRKLLVDKLKKRLGNNLKGKKIAILGLAFKDNTDDVRESAALDIIKWLIDDHASVYAYDPVAEKNARLVLSDQCEFSPDPYHAAQDAHAIVIATEWPEFTELDFIKLKKLLSTPLVFDGKNILDKQLLTDLGFEYYGMGR